MTARAGDPGVETSGPLLAPDTVPTLTERHYQRLAWAVMALGFLVFSLVIAGGLWAGFNYYVAQPNDPHKALVQRAHGSKLEVRHAGQKTTVTVSDRLDLVEGDTVQTDDNTDALITLFDRSTIQLSYNSNLILQRMRSSRFQTQAKYFKLILNSGQLKVASAAVQPYDEMKMLINTPDEAVSISVDANSVAVINVADPPLGGVRLTASTALGKMHVKTNGQWQQILPEQMAQIGHLEEPLAVQVQRAANELVANGTFKAAASSGNLNLVAEGWTLTHIPATTTDPPAVVQVITQTVGSPTHFVQLARSAAGRPPQDVVEVDLRQEINKVVSYYTRLDFSAQIQIAAQSAVGPGVYPLKVRVTYEDADGKQGFWDRNFYALTGAPNFTPGDTAFLIQDPPIWWVPAIAPVAPTQPATWDLLQQVPRPARITSLELIVTGYSFNVSATNISLNAH